MQQITRAPGVWVCDWTPDRGYCLCCEAASGLTQFCAKTVAVPSRAEPSRDGSGKTEAEAKNGNTEAKNGSTEAENGTTEAEAEAERFSTVAGGYNINNGPRLRCYQGYVVV